MVVNIAVTYLIAGMTGILVGHDILDTVLMIFLVTGTYLASGTVAAGTRKGLGKLDRTPQRQPG
jgi:O-antigen ligase